MVQDIIWKADSHSACQKILCFFTEPEGPLPSSQKPPLDPVLSQLNPIRPIDPYLPKVHLNVILPPTPRSSQWSLTLGPSNQNPVNASPLPHASHMSRPPHPPWLNLDLIIFCEEYRLWISSLWNFLHDPSTSLLGPNILLNTLFSNTLSLCSSLKMRDQVSQQYCTIGKIAVLYILIFRFFIWDGKTKDFGLNHQLITFVKIL
jgi:hypothetical protein